MVSKSSRKYFFYENFEMHFFETIGYPFLRLIFLFCDLPAKKPRDPKILSCLTENSYFSYTLLIKFPNYRLTGVYFFEEFSYKFRKM